MFLMIHSVHSHVFGTFNFPDPFSSKAKRNELLAPQQLLLEQRRNEDTKNRFRPGDERTFTGGSTLDTEAEIYTGESNFPVPHENANIRKGGCLRGRDF